MSAPNIVAGWIAAAVKVERERYEPCVEALREIAGWARNSEAGDYELGQIARRAESALAKVER